MEQSHSVQGSLVNWLPQVATMGLSELRLRLSVAYALDRKQAKAVCHRHVCDMIYCAARRMFGLTNNAGRGLTTWSSGLAEQTHFRFVRRLRSSNETVGME